MNYTGEHLLPGQIGHFFAVLSLVASLVATLAYYSANRALLPADKQSWLKLARGAFLVETVSVLGVFSCLYYIITNHYFEYKYAWQHSDRIMDTQYLLSGFWEGQEGSFLLWSFWHCVLGWILIATTKKLEAPVMTVVSFAQFCLATMLLGVYVFDLKIGTSPFVLMRNEGMFDNAPAFRDIATGALRQDYLSLIQDGNGISILLQNYWMVIHPPVLFLGFASTIVPFAFAYAGFVNNNDEWIKPVLPWASFSAAVLGTGIMMGAAWAYESLSFAGYWAWDPVENASLVPWLILVGGLHTNLIYKSTGYSLRTTYLFYFLSFILILYSTFLTRSGILGDTSVHAFTGADMNVQLYLFMALFIWLLNVTGAADIKQKLIVTGFFVGTLVAGYFYPPTMLLSFFGGLGIVYYYLQKNVPSVNKEESSYSREFWMFIGALVLFLASIIISFKTSVPVFNKLLGTKMANPEEPEFSYNQVQIFIAIIIGILTAATQYLRYKDTPKQLFVKKVLWPTVAAIALSLLISVFGGIQYDKHGVGFLAAIHIALFASAYAVVANASYIWIGLKGKLKSAGASVAHVGFGLVLLGVLLSSAKKEVLSKNTSGIALFEKTKNEDPAENMTLFQGIKTDMGKYHVTYVNDTFGHEANKRFFKLAFEHKATGENFTLYPDVIKGKGDNAEPAANPDKKHYANKDIFVYVSSWLDADKADTSSFQPREMKTGDTTFYSNGFIVLNKVDINPAQVNRPVNPGETVMLLDMTVFAKNGAQYPVKPGIALAGNTIRNLQDSVIAQNLVLKFNKVKDEKNGILEIGLKEASIMNNAITLKVYEFPFINILWIGIIIMVIGFIMSIRYRYRMRKLNVVK
ncbi:cytochrome c biogenesis protein CcsA [Foetidibacter luteolus]|uniref:cytochrome c biogenesis protein CcsA n=1 Tax=Foetidibacter luteolus TaxID=2608880 RepID=UPI00129AAB60|nr:cytochrome c biogenesis protein CcsA [Foetidibacter luteolus]